MQKHNVEVDLTPIQSPGCMLQSARQRIGLTQCQVAEGIATLSLYSKFETYEAYPTLERSRLLCERLGIDIVAFRTTIDDYRGIDKEIRLASRRLDFKTIYRLCVEVAKGEQSETVRRRYLDKARIARSLGGAARLCR